MSAVPVERFKATSGFFAGYIGLVLAVFVVGYVLLSVHTVTGLRVALGMTLFGLVTWVTQLRSRAAAYPDHLLLKNSVRDAVIPLTLITEVSVRQTLNVWVGERRYVCIGIGASVRSIFKNRKKPAASPLGMSRMREFSEMAERAAPDQSAMAYEAFVVTRIDELVEASKKKAAEEAGTGKDHYVYAWPEITALTVTGVAFLVSQFI
jgi:hypothetical protein